MSMTDIFKLVEKFLTYGRVKKDKIDVFTSPDNMMDIFQAFIHKSSGKFNSDVLKFIGDPLYDASIVNYIRVYYPMITSVHWKTKVKHHMQVTDKLTKFLESEFQFSKYCRYNDETYHFKVPASELKDHIVHYTFRAFLGALFKIICRVEMVGTAYSVIYRIVSSVFNQINLPITYVNVVDPKTRLKETLMQYTGKNKNNFKMHEYFVIKPTGVQTPLEIEEITGVQYVGVVTIPVKGKNVVIAEDTGEKHIVDTNISVQALKYFKDKLGLQVNTNMEYQNYKIDFFPITDQPISEGYRAWIKKQLSHVTYDVDAVFTKHWAMSLLNIAVTHKSKSPTKNYESLEFFGDSVANSVLCNVIKRKLPLVVNSKYLSNIKFNLINTRSLSSFARDIGLSRFIISDITLTDSILEDVFEAFIGAVYQIFVILYDDAVAYGVIQGLVDVFTKNTIFSLASHDIFDPKSVLKEMFDGQGWKHLPRDLFNVFRKDNVWHAYVGAYLNGDRSADPRNKRQLVNIIRDTEKEASRDASILAIEALKKYGIEANIPSPYQ